jgi:hypothetical protein
LADLLGDENHPLPHVSGQESLQDVPIKRGNILDILIDSFTACLADILAALDICVRNLALPFLRRFFYFFKIINLRELFF